MSVANRSFATTDWAERSEDQSSRYLVEYDDEYGITISHEYERHSDATTTPEIFIENTTMHHARIMPIDNYPRIIGSITMNRHITHIWFDGGNPTCALGLLQCGNIKYLKFVCERLDVQHLIDNLHTYTHLKTLLLHMVRLDSVNVSKLAAVLQRVNISALHVSTSACFDELITDKLTYFSVYSFVDPPNGFDKIANNTTITHLSLWYVCSLDTITTDAIADALRRNKTIKSFEYCTNDVVPDTIISAINASTSIKRFRNRCVDDYNAFRCLLLDSAIESIDVNLSQHAIVKHEIEIIQLFKNNLIVQKQHGIDLIHDRISAYLERNRALTWPCMHKNLLNTSLILLMLPFDPYVIMKIFDHVYESEYIHTGRKINLIFNVRNSISRL